MTPSPVPTRSGLRSAWFAAAGLAASAALASSAAAEEILGVRDDGALVTFDTGNPGVFTSERAITGLPQGEILLGADFRPGDGALFAVGSLSRVYRILTDTGAAVPVGPGPFTPSVDGTDFSLSFDTAGDLMRVTSNTGQNLVLDASTGLVAATDPPLVYAAGDANAGLTAGITACAWTYTAQAGGILYGIDLARGLLVKIDVPSAGSVRTVGPLGVTGLVPGGFSALDVSSDTGVLYAVLAPQNGSVSRVYQVNVATGTASQLGVALPALLRTAAVVPSSPPAPPGTRLVGLVAPADVVSFTIGAPQSILRTVHVKGLAAGDAFLGISVRPKSGVLYGLTRTGLYDIDLDGGTAELVGGGLGRTLAAAQIGCDFDPATDRIRVTDATGLNLRVHPDSGAVVGDDTAFEFAAGDSHFGTVPTVGAITFTGRASPGTTSRCFVIDTNEVIVARLGTAASAPDEARDGKLFTAGELAIDTVVSLPPNLGLIATSDRTAYASVQFGPSASRLYQVDLGRGLATQAGSIGTSLLVRALTAEPTADPPRFDVTKASLVLNFKKPAHDAFTLKGAAPLAIGSVAGKTVRIDVGGLVKTFDLDLKGKGESGDDTLSIGGNATRGIKMKLKWKKEDFVSVLADEDMTGAVFARRSARRVVMILTVDGHSYRTTVELAYSAKPGKTGTAVTN